MKKLLLGILLSMMSIGSSAQTKWSVDPMHSFVNFTVKHLGISFVDGSFKKFDGSIQAKKTDWSDAKIEFSVDVNSLTTGVEARDNHLKTDDFFNAEKFPKMSFVSTSFRNVGDLNYELKGKLTIRDITRDVTFEVINGGTAKDQQGNSKVGFQATTVINRLDYNIKYDPTGMGVGRDVKIVLNLEFAQVK